MDDAVVGVYPFGARRTTRLFVTAWDVAGALIAERAYMDFIERWFGVSPDGGDGSIELMYLIVLIVVVVALLYRPVLKHFFGKRRRRLS